MQHLTESQLHELERKRVHFRQHIIVFLVVNAIFWLVWYSTGSGYMWPIWPAAFWVVPIIFHYMDAWGE